MFYNCSLFKLKVWTLLIALVSLTCWWYNTSLADMLYVIRALMRADGITIHIFSEVLMEIQKGICYWEREVSVSITIFVFFKEYYQPKNNHKKTFNKVPNIFSIEKFKLVDIAKYLYMLHLKPYIYVTIILDTAYSLKF